MSTNPVLEGQVIFITGAAGLIGRRFVSVVLKNGGQVVAADVSEQGLSELEALFGGPSFLGVKVDVNDAVSVTEGLEQAIEHFGRVSGLVNSAYPRNANYGRDFLCVEYDDFCENVNLNLASTFLVSKIFATYFKELKQGNILNLGSIYGVVAPKFGIYENTSMTVPVEYAAIKAAVIQLTKYMAQYLKKDGVRVNCISPGGVFDHQPKPFLIKYKDQCGLQGMLEPEHLDSALLFLLGEQSKMVTGQNIVVDDGFTL
ncbi:MAG: SDR family oxidoreductase [Gammaproteobacteria bacterium]|nr:SDR family oxidoreductase [Gammaproteobacteria bacterium]